MRKKFRRDVEFISFISSMFDDNTRPDSRVPLPQKAQHVADLGHEQQCRGTRGGPDSHPAERSREQPNIEIVGFDRIDRAAFLPARPKNSCATAILELLLEEPCQRHPM